MTQTQRSMTRPTEPSGPESQLRDLEISEEIIRIASRPMAAQRLKRRLRDIQIVFFSSLAIATACFLAIQFGAATEDRERALLALGVVAGLVLAILAFLALKVVAWTAYSQERVQRTRAQLEQLEGEQDLERRAQGLAEPAIQEQILVNALGDRRYELLREQDETCRLILESASRYVGAGADEYHRTTGADLPQRT